MIYQSLTFWTLVAGLLAFVARWYFPAFPFDEVTILAALLFVLGLIGVVPQIRARGAITPNIVNSLAFWQLIAGFTAFILHFFAPGFPFDQVAILAFILFVLGWFGIKPELRARGLLPGAEGAQPESVGGVAFVGPSRSQIGMVLMLLAILLVVPGSVPSIVIWVAFLAGAGLYLF